LKKKYILAIFFITIIAFCGTATAADTDHTAVNDQVTTSSVQDNPTVDTSSPTTASSTQSNLQDTQSDTDPNVVNDQAISSTTPSPTQNAPLASTMSITSDPQLEMLITFDDGYESTYTIAYPIMQQYGIVGTVYMIVDNVGKPGYLTLEELTELHNAGWTIADHTWSHAYLTELTQTQLTNEFQSAINWLNQNGFSDGAYHLAYPYGAYDNTVIQVCEQLGIKTARTTNFGTISSDGVVDYLQLPTKEIYRPTVRNDWQTYINDGIATESTTIFYLHDIVASNPSILETITTATFNQFIVDIAQTGVRTLNINQWYSEINNAVPVAFANPIGGSYNTDKIVTLSMNKEGSIYYTTDGSVPTISSTQYTAPISITSTTVLNFFAVDLEGNLSPMYTKTYTIDKVAPTATADLPIGTYNTLKSVKLTAADNMDTNPLIYYSTDGTTWKNQAKTVTINLKQGITTLKFYAMDAAGNQCTTQTNTYTIDTTKPTATADLPVGTYNTLKSVTLTAADNMDTNPLIYYSIDNGLTWKNQLKTVTINLKQGLTTLMFYAVDSAGNQCTTQTNTYTIDVIQPTVSANPTGGSYNTGKIVTLSMNKDGSIYYTIDGSVPTTSSTKYTTSISITSTTVLNFFAVDLAGNLSPMYTKTYTIDKVAPTASDNLNSGLYNTNKLVTLSMSEPGSIYYSLNGGTPSTLYTSPIYISWTCNLKYNAVDMANNPSPIYSKTYNIDKVAPKVSKTSPTNRKTGISRTSYIYIRFSEYYKNSTYWSKIRVKNLKTGKYLSISKYLSGSLLKIKTSKRSANRWYQVIIPLASIKDNAGNNLKTTYTFKFKTRG
jgi:peptidoglycan/xylan/chitin deacetylase (PgdA/CDA1 family)